MKYYSLYQSPLGQITMISDGVNLTSLGLPTQGVNKQNAVLRNDLPVFINTKKWLNDYFTGVKPNTALPDMLTKGTPFQEEIWQMLLDIPYGELVTYGDIAKKIGEKQHKRMSAQAVGGAVGSNPISIIIPCHRVVGASGSLTGYAGGLDIKEALLKIEGHDLTKFKR